MRAIVFLCLLHPIFNAADKYSWDGYGNDQPVNNNNSTYLPEACVADKAACGCCMMTSKIDRMRMYFNQSAAEISHYLHKCKKVLDELKGNRSVFSVALNNGQQLSCQGPFNASRVIEYKHVFINFGKGYEVSTGVFTAPDSGVYSIAATIYSNDTTGLNVSACASVRVNGAEIKFLEKFQGDPEDSNTVVMALKLKAGDQVNVALLPGCIVCDDINHYNTFTGFLLYTTHEKS